MADDPIKLLNFSSAFTVTEPTPGEYTIGLTPSSAPTLESLADTVFTSLTVGQVLKWDGTNWVNGTDNTGGGGGTGATILDELGDVTLSSPANNHYLRYNGSAWVNTAFPTLVTNLDGLSDVTITSPTNGQVLKYDGSAWVNGTDNGGAAGVLTVNTVNGTTASMYFNDDFGLHNAGLAYSYQRTGDVLRFEVRDGDQWTVDANAGSASERSEIASGKEILHRQVYTMHYRLFIEPGAVMNGNWTIIGQIHHRNDPGESGGSPPLAFEFGSNDVPALIYRTDPNAIRVGSGPSAQNLWVGTALQRGVWHDFLLEFRIDWQGTGYVKFWLNGNLVLNTGNRAIGYNDQDGGYWKIGIYRSGSNTNTLAIQIDNPTLIEGSGTSYTLVSGDLGEVVNVNDSSSAIVALPNDLPVGWHCQIVQGGAGAITFSPAAGATLRHRSNHTKSAGQYSVQRLVVLSNSTGTNAVYSLSGDTAA